MTGLASASEASRAATVKSTALKLHSVHVDRLDQNVPRVASTISHAIQMDIVSRMELAIACLALLEQTAVSASMLRPML
jgi:hypothetical protein